MSLSKESIDLTGENSLTMFLNNLQQDFCVKIPVENYEEYCLIKTNLRTAIKLIADHNECTDEKSVITHSIGTLVDILDAFGSHEEV